MAQNHDDPSEEKELIGSILSDQEEVSYAPKAHKKKLSLHSKAFEQYPDPHSSEASSYLSTGHVSYQKPRGFFQHQTSIEISSQYPPHQSLTDDRVPSMEQLKICSQEQFQKKPSKKHYTLQPQEVRQNHVYMSDKQIEGQQPPSQSDLEQICGSQPVNRKLQNVLEYGDPQARLKIFLKVESMCLKASKDMFGNYTVQKLLDVGEAEWKFRIFSQLQEHVCELSRNTYGCRVVQKLLEFIKDKADLQEYFLKAITGQLKQLCLDQNGNSVLLQCLDTMPKWRMEFVLPYVEDCVRQNGTISQLIFMSKQTYGCRIIQKVLELYPESCQRLLDSLMQIAQQLCFSEYGNYIIQFILKNGPAKERNFICQIIKDHFEQLSMNKFGSNTVEKYIDYFGPQQIMKVLVSYSKNQEFVFFNLAINPYGNYVIKKVLICGDQQSMMIMKLLLRQSPDLLGRIKASEFGQRVGQILETL